MAYAAMVERLDDVQRLRTQRPLISIVLPVRNQADHIESVVRLHHEELLQLPIDFEILLIPNDCSDESQSICENLANQLKNVRTVIGSGPGWGSAVRFGLNNASGDFLCYASSARINSSDIAKHIVAALNNPNCVIKARRLAQDNAIRSAGSILYNGLCRSLLKVDTWDVNGTPKVFPKRFYNLLELTEHGYLLDVEFNVICKRQGYPLLEIPIEHTTRHGGTSTTSWSTAFKLYFDLITFWLNSFRPRRLGAWRNSYKQTSSG